MYLEWLEKGVRHKSTTYSRIIAASFQHDMFKAMDIWFVGTHPSLESFLKSQGDGKIKK